MAILVAMLVAALTALALLRPARRELFQWPSSGSPVFVGLAVAGAVPLVLYARRSVT